MMMRDLNNCKTTLLLSLQPLRRNCETVSLQPQGDVAALATFKDMYFYQQIVAWLQAATGGQQNVSSPFF